MRDVNVPPTFTLFLSRLSSKDYKGREAVILVLFFQWLIHCQWQQEHFNRAVVLQSIFSPNTHTGAFYDALNRLAHHHISKRAAMSHTTMPPFFSVVKSCKEQTQHFPKLQEHNFLFSRQGLRHI